MNQPGQFDAEEVLRKHLNAIYDRAWAKAIEVLNLSGHLDAAKLLEVIGANFREARDLDALRAEKKT